MKNPRNSTSLVWLAVIITCSPLHVIYANRSVHRPIDATLPSIKVQWKNSVSYEQLRNTHLEYYPLFCNFDQAYFQSHLLPQGGLAFRDAPHKAVSTQLLNNYIEKLLAEVQARKKKYTHFTVLQSKDFNRRKACGLLVVKFKEFPFVVKLFIETPNSFVHPECKGFEPIFFFYMGGGVNRHLSGFTRVKNLEHINTQLQAHPEWKELVKTPRKWFWLPNDPHWISITGTNIGPNGNAYTEIPGTYAIVADAIVADHTFSITNAAHREQALKLCNYLDLYVDPHISNFMIEQSTGKIAIVDTEHFPTIVGFKEKRFISSYFDWYLQLVTKCIEDSLFRPKSAQQRKSALSLF